MSNDRQSRGEARARERSGKPGSLSRFRDFWWGRRTEVEMEGPMPRDSVRLRILNSSLIAGGEPYAVTGTQCSYKGKGGLFHSPPDQRPTRRPLDSTPSRGEARSRLLGRARQAPARRHDHGRPLTKAMRSILAIVIEIPDQELQVIANGSEISLPFSQVGPSRVETLVSPAGPHRFRIEEVHGLVEAFRYGDVIEAERLPDGAWRFRRVIEKGRFRQVTLGLSRAAQESPHLQGILDELVAHGGQWEKMFGSWLTMAMPYGMPFNPLHRVRRLGSTE